MSSTIRYALALSLLLPAAAQAADETHFGATVASVALTKTIPGASLSLKNMSASKIASQRKLTVVGADPAFTLIGQAFCKQGARLTKVQAIAGKVVLHGQDIFSAQIFGQSPKLTDAAGKDAADLSVPVTLKVSRVATDAAIDLSFNPARAFERKIDAYVKQGGSAAEYLRQTQAIEMPVTLNLIAWCRMDPGANSVLAGKTYAGFVARPVTVTVLYNGDPAIVDGPAARATTKTQGAETKPPARTEPPKPKRAPVTAPQ